MNESFGARLRRQRERQHITLGQIAASTKIQASLFEGLERNDVSRWPGGIFRRSFIRAYAEAVGLNPDQICREFLERFPEPFPDGLAALALSEGAVVLPARPAAPAPQAVMSPQLVIEEVPEPPFLIASAEPETDKGEEPRLVLADSAGSGAPLPVAATRLWSEPVQTETPMLARWQAAAIDVVFTLLLSLVGYAVLGTFWAPLAVASLLCSVVATLMLGRTPGAALAAGALSIERWTPRAARARTAVPEPPVTEVLDLPAPRQTRGETREAREAIEALEVATLESLAQPVMSIADAEVAATARPAAYPALRPPFDLERPRRARA